MWGSPHFRVTASYGGGSIRVNPPGPRRRRSSSLSAVASSSRTSKPARTGGDPAPPEARGAAALDAPARGTPQAWLGVKPRRPLTTRRAERRFKAALGLRLT